MTDPTPLFARLFCAIPEVPSNVQLVTSNQTALAYECTAYHVLHSGSLIRMCKNGSWTGNAPYCVIDSVLPKPYLVLLITGVTILLFLVCIPIDFYRYRKRKNESRERQARMALIARIAPYHVVLVSEPAPQSLHAFSRRKMGLRSLFTFFKLMKDARSRTELRAAEKRAMTSDDPRIEASTASGGLELSDGVYLNDKNGDVRFDIYRSTPRGEEALRQQMANGAFAANLPSTSASFASARGTASAPPTLDAKGRNSQSRPPLQEPASPGKRLGKRSSKKEEVTPTAPTPPREMTPATLNRESGEKTVLNLKTKGKWLNAYELLALKKSGDNGPSGEQQTSPPQGNHAPPSGCDVIRPTSLEAAAKKPWLDVKEKTATSGDEVTQGRTTESRRSPWKMVRLALLSKAEAGRGRCELDPSPSLSPSPFPSPAFSSYQEADEENAMSPVEPDKVRFVCRDSSGLVLDPASACAPGGESKGVSRGRGEGRSGVGLRWVDLASSLRRGQGRLWQNADRHKQDGAKDSPGSPPSDSSPQDASVRAERICNSSV